MAKAMIQTSSISVGRWLVVAVALVSCRVAAADWSANLGVSTEYVYRGQALSDHDPAVSAGLDFEHESGAFAGAWASTIDLGNASGRRRVELDAYIGYRFEPIGPFGFSTSLIRYSYPDDTSSFDYDYNEVVIAATIFERYSLEFGYSDDVYGFDASGRNVELRGDWPVATYWVLGAGLGYNSVDASPRSRYAYWDIGVSTRVSRLAIDLRWFDNEPIPGRISSWSAGSRAVLGLTLGF